MTTQESLLSEALIKMTWIALSARSSRSCFTVVRWSLLLFLDKGLIFVFELCVNWGFLLCVFQWGCGTWYPLSIIWWSGPLRMEVLWHPFNCTVLSEGLELNTLHFSMDLNDLVSSLFLNFTEFKRSVQYSRMQTMGESNKKNPQHKKNPKQAKKPSTPQYPHFMPSGFINESLWSHGLPRWNQIK